MAIGSGVVRAGRAYVEINADNSRFLKKMHETEATFRNFGSQLTQVSAQMLSAMTAIAAPIALSTKLYSEFDDVMRSVYSTAGKIAKVDMNAIGVDYLPGFIANIDKTIVEARAINREFKDLTGTARELGATTSYTAKQAAEAMLVLARAGFTISEIQDSVGHILNLARSTGTDVAEATQIMIGALRSFNIEASKSERVVDLLVATANSSPQALSDIGSAMKYIGPVAKSLHLSLQDTLVDLGALANFNIKGEQGGTALRNIYLRLASAKNQAKLKETFGVEIVGDDGEFKKIVPVLKEIQTHIDKTGMSTAEVANSFKEIFGMRSAPAALSLMNADLTRIEDALSDVDNLASDQAKMMDEGLGGAIRMLISRFQELQIAITNAFSGPAGFLIKGLTNSLRVIASIVEHNKGVIKVAAYFLGTLGLITAAFGTLSLAVGVTTRSISSLMTQFRKFGSLKTSTRWLDSKFFVGRSQDIGNNDIQVKPVDRAREATRYLSENVSGLSKSVVSTIARFNRLGNSFDLIANKANMFRTATIKFSQSAGLAKAAMLPLNVIVEGITKEFQRGTKSVNSIRMALNRNSQAVNKLHGSYSALKTSLIHIINLFGQISISFMNLFKVFSTARTELQLLITKFGTFKTGVTEASDAIKSITKIGRSLNSIFRTTGKRIGSAADSLKNFKTNLRQVKNKDTAGFVKTILGYLEKLSEGFYRAAGGAKLLADGLRTIGRVSLKTIEKLEKVVAIINAFHHPKTFANYIQSMTPELPLPPKPPATSAKPKKKDEASVPPLDDKVIVKLVGNLTLLARSIKLVGGGFRAIRRAVKIIEQALVSLATSVEKLVNLFGTLKTALTTFLSDIKSVKDGFVSLTDSIKTNIRETRTALTSLERIKKAFRGLSLKRVIRDTNNLNKGMVALGDAMRYLVSNRTLVEGTMIGIGTAFEKAAVGAMTMAQAVRSVVKNLKELPKLANLEKRLDKSETGNAFRNRNKTDAQKNFTAERAQQLAEQVRRDNRRNKPNYDGEIHYVSGEQGMRDRANDLQLKEDAVAKAEADLKDPNSAINRRETARKQQDQINSAVNSILAGNRAYQDIKTEKTNEIGTRRTDNVALQAREQETVRAKANFESTQIQIDSQLESEIKKIEANKRLDEANVQKYDALLKNTNTPNYLRTGYQQKLNEARARLNSGIYDNAIQEIERFRKSNSHGLVLGTQNLSLDEMIQKGQGRSSLFQEASYHANQFVQDVLAGNRPQMYSVSLTEDLANEIARAQSVQKTNTDYITAREAEIAKAEQQRETRTNALMHDTRLANGTVQEGVRSKLVRSIMASNADSFVQLANELDKQGKTADAQYVRDFVSNYHDPLTQSLMKDKGMTKEGTQVGIIGKGNNLNEQANVDDYNTRLQVIANQASQNNIQGLSFESLPQAVKSYSDAERAGLLTQSIVPGAWTDAEMARGGLRETTLRDARDTLANARADLKTEQSKLTVRDEMKPLLEKGGLSDKLKNTEQRIAAFRNEMSGLQELQAKQGLTADQQARYWDLQIKLTQEEEVLAKRQKLHTEALKAAQSKIEQSIKSSQEYKDVERAKSELAKAEKSGNKADIKTARQNLTAAEDKFRKFRDTDLGYENLQKKIKLAEEDKKLTDKSLETAKEWQECIKYQQNVNQSRLDAIKEEEEKAKQTIKEIQEEAHKDGKRPLTEKETKAIDTLNNQISSAETERKALETERAQLAKDAQEAAEAVKNRTRDQREASAYHDRLSQVNTVYGNAFRGNPAIDDKSKQRLAQAKAQYNAAKANFMDNSMWKNLKEKSSMFKTNMVDIGKYLGVTAKELFRTGKFARNTEYSLKAAAAGFMILNGIAVTFAGIMAMVAEMLGMAVIMAVVSAIISALTQLGKFLWGLVSKTAEEREAQRKEEYRRKYEEKMSADKEKVDRASTQREKMAEKVDRLKELSKKEKLTKNEAYEAERLASSISPTDSSKIFTKRVTMNKSGKIEYENTINKEELNAAYDEYRKNEQIEIAKAIQKAADEITVHEFWRSDAHSSERGLEETQKLREELVDLIDQLNNTGEVKDPEAERALNAAIHALDTLESQQNVAAREILTRGVTESTLTGLGFGEKRALTYSRYKQASSLAKGMKEQLVAAKYGSGSNILNTEEILTSEEPFAKDLSDALNKKKVDPTEVNEAYESYVDKLTQDLEKIQDAFLDSANKEDLKEAQAKIEKTLKETRESYRKASFSLIKELENKMPKYGVENDMVEIGDEIAKNLEAIENAKEGRIKLEKNKLQGELSDKITAINKEYQQYETVEQIEQDRQMRIRNILASGASKEDMERMKDEVYRQTQERMKNAVSKERQEELDKERKSKVDALKNEYKKKEDKATEDITKDFDNEKEKQYSVYTHLMQSNLDKRLEQVVTNSRSNVLHAQATRQSRLLNLDEYVDYLAAREYEKEQYDIDHNTQNLDIEQLEAKQDELDKKKSDYVKNYKKSDQYKAFQADIDKEYKDAIDPKRLLQSLSPYADNFLNADIQLDAFKKSADDWLNRAIAEDTESLQKQLDVEKGKQKNEQDAQKIIALEKQLENARAASQRKHSDTVKQKQAAFEKAQYDQIERDLWSDESVQNKFTTNNRAKDAQHRIKIDTIQQMIDRQEEIKANAAEGSEELKQALKRIDDLNLLKTMAEAFKEASEKMEAIQAKYAKQQFDFAMTHFGLTDEKAKIAEEKETKLAELEEEYKKRYEAETDAGKKAKLERDYKAYQEFIEQEYEFKEKNFQYDDFKDPNKKKESEIREKWRSKLYESLIAHGFELKDVEFNAETGELSSKNKEVQSLIEAAEHKADLEVADLKDEYRDFSTPLKQRQNELKKEYRDKVREAMKTRGIDEGLLEIDQNGNMTSKDPVVRRLINLANGMRETQIKAETDDFTDPVKKKSAEIRKDWQDKMLAALDANGIALEDVRIDPQTGRMTVANGKGQQILNQGNATMDAEIAAVEFEEEKKQSDYNVKSRNYMTTKPIIDQIDLSIASLETMTSGNEQADHALEMQIKQLRYNKAVLEARQFDAQLVNLQAQAKKAFEIWQTASKKGASKEEVQKAFDRYAQLTDEIQSTKSNMINAFKEVASARKDFQQAMNNAANAADVASTGTFKAIEAQSSSWNQERGNIAKQQLSCLRQIANNTSIQEIV